MSILKDFRDFAMRGNVLDLAVAVIVGGAFGKIVSSFVNDILMPPIGMLLGGLDFTQYKIVLKAGHDAVMEGANVITPAVSEVAFRYGAFIQTTVDFLIIAFSVFLVVKVAQKLERKKKEAPAPPPVPSNEEKLLTEIRDILKSRSS
jgi:large conductance mechanosensitive channel